MANNKNLRAAQSKGGKVRAKKLSAKRRQEIARMGGLERQKRLRTSSLGQDAVSGNYSVTVGDPIVRIYE